MRVSIGQWADKGGDPTRQAFQGACIPAGTAIATKGIALAVADGISSGTVGPNLSGQVVAGFLSDYGCTAETWSVKTSATRVLAATNAWLHGRNPRGRSRQAQPHGFACSFGALILTSRQAHLFLVGDVCVRRLVGCELESLARRHRVELEDGRSLPARALGVEPFVEIDCHVEPVEEGDVFLLTAGGVHDHVDAGAVAAALLSHPHDLDAAARRIVDAVRNGGGGRPCAAQLLRVEALGPQGSVERLTQLDRLPLPPRLEPRMVLDGYTVLRELRVSHRSHVHLARDEDSGATVVLKTPSTELRGERAALERFLLEEWVAGCIHHPHVLRPHLTARPKSCLYLAFEYVEGVTLTQWMRDHPRPTLEAVRTIIEQIADGLRAFHRLEILHQDLRPDNVMIDRLGMVKIIDFGAVRAAGLDEMLGIERAGEILGTEQYTAPEYFVGEGGTPRSDQFSLGVIAYQMLCGRLPYGADVSRMRSRAAQAKLNYRSMTGVHRSVPPWLDGVLRKAVHPQPMRRYEALSAFVRDLRHPRRDLPARARAPWAERNPARFWQAIALGLLLLALGLLHALLTMPGR